jgi:hypothetical protein
MTVWLCTADLRVTLTVGTVALCPTVKRITRKRASTQIGLQMTKFLHQWHEKGAGDRFGIASEENQAAFKLAQQTGRRYIMYPYCGFEMKMVVVDDGRPITSEFCPTCKQ